MQFVKPEDVKENMLKYGFYAPDMTVHELVEDELPVIEVIPLDELCDFLSWANVMDCRICNATTGLCRADESNEICHSKERWKQILMLLPQWKRLYGNE
jgi:hypothetical protein